VGFYEGAKNPGFVSRLNVGKTPGDITTYAADPASSRVMDAVAAAHGLVGAQKQSAWNFASSKAAKGHPLGDMDVIQLNQGRPMDEAQLSAIMPKLQAIGADVPMADPYGARALVFPPEGLAGKGLVKHNQGIAKQARLLGDELGTDVRFLKRSGNLLGDGGPSWSSKPYISALEQGGPKMVAGFDNAMQDMGPKLLQAAEDFATKKGMQSAPWYRPMMEALSTTGLAGLKELVAKGIVPVSALAAVLAQAPTESAYSD